ncbi:MAG: hypothetical protein F6K62_12000 [Sphaerospermopsis sp. SIO1G2]|nr:hypothetical protein [Sphaerospermopsis sp. SIO1G2]
MGMLTLRHYAILALALLITQAGFWYMSADHLPNLGIVPELSSKEELEMLSLGDHQLLFRIMAFRMNNTGDTFGRFSRLGDYDMEKIYHWFTLLDLFDNRSDHLAALSAYYFSQTQNEEDVTYLVDYLYEHSHTRPQEKWWWLAQATYLAMHKLEDHDRALEIANHLKGVADIPYWAQQMPAFVHEARGEEESAMLIMLAILREDDKLTQGELNYIRYFMEERIKEQHEDVQRLLQQQQQRLDAQQDRLLQSD